MIGAMPETTSALFTAWESFYVIIGSSSAALTGLMFVVVSYVVVVMRRARRQTDYKPVFEDIWWHMVLPLVAYGMLIGAAWSLVGGNLSALFFFGRGDEAFGFSPHP